MRIRICSVYDTAYKYKEILKDYNYEHVLVNKRNVTNKDFLSDYEKNDYEDYITINSINEIIKLMNDLKLPIIIDNVLYTDTPYLEIYDTYRE